MDLCSPVTWVSKDSGMCTVLCGGMTPQGEGLESRTAGGFSYSYRETKEGTNVILVYFETTVVLHPWRVIRKGCLAHHLQQSWDKDPGSAERT